MVDIMINTSTIELTDDEIIAQLREEAGKASLGLTLDAQNALKKNGLPIIMASSDFLLEIPVAMDCSFSNLTVTGSLGTAMPNAAELIDSAAGIDLESRMCTAIKVAAYYLESGQLIVPDMVITSNACCDAIDTLGMLMRNYKPWSNVPKFILDAPNSEDEAGFVYFGQQLRQAVTFIEGVLGKKMDWERLRKVCLETNKQNQLLIELRELKKAIPCPVDPDLIHQGITLSKWLSPASPQVTDWLERLLGVAERQVKAKNGISGVQEKIRYLWQDVNGTWAGSTVIARLQKELGAVCLMDYVSFAPWSLTDLSSEESMFTSFAKHALLEPGMNRQSLHSTALFCDDILRCVVDFKCDAVILPAHIGHRDVNCRLEIVRDMCHKKGIPYLILGFDAWDKRYMPPEVVFDRIKTFFETTGLL